MRVLESQVQDLRSHITSLQSVINNQVSVKPDVCTWEKIKPHMKVLSKQLILGLDPQKNRPYPRDDHIKEAILEEFNVLPTDTYTRNLFNRVWMEGLRSQVKVYIVNRRGRFATTTRRQLWRNLGVPIPETAAATEVEMEAWKQSLVPLFEGMPFLNLKGFF